MYIYLGAGGRADAVVPDDPKKQVQQSWLIEDSKFCRTLPKGKELCFKVFKGDPAAPPAGKKIVRALTFVNAKKNQMGAWVLEGRQLDASAVAAAPRDLPPPIEFRDAEERQQQNGSKGKRTRSKPDDSAAPGKNKKNASESEKFVAKMFSRIDRDGDGFATREEFLAIKKSGGQVFDTKLDLNKDGKLTVSELAESFQTFTTEAFEILP